MDSNNESPSPPPPSSPSPPSPPLPPHATSTPTSDNTIPQPPLITASYAAYLARTGKPDRRLSKAIKFEKKELPPFLLALRHDIVKIARRGYPGAEGGAAMDVDDADTSIKKGQDTGEILADVSMREPEALEVAADPSSSNYDQMPSSPKTDPASMVNKSRANAIPHEILSHIFSFVDLNATLFACTLTCKWWSTVAITTMWEEVSLTTEVSFQKFVRSAIYSASRFNPSFEPLYQISLQEIPNTDIFDNPPVPDNPEEATAVEGNTVPATLTTTGIGLVQSFMTLAGSVASHLALPPMSPAIDGIPTLPLVDESPAPSASYTDVESTIMADDNKDVEAHLASNTAKIQHGKISTQPADQELTQGNIRDLINFATFTRIRTIPSHLRPSLFLFPSSVTMTPLPMFNSNGLHGANNTQMPPPAILPWVASLQASLSPDSMEFPSALAAASLASAIGGKMEDTDEEVQEELRKKGKEAAIEVVGLAGLVKRLSLPTLEAKVPLMGMLNGLLRNLVRSFSPLMGMVDSLAIEDANETCWPEICLCLQLWGARIRSVNIEAVGNMDAFDSPEDLEPVFTRMPSLEFLRLDGIPIGTNGAINNLASYCLNLKVLTLDYCLEISMGTLPIVWNGCKNLTFLGLAGIVGDQELPPGTLGFHHHLKTLRLVDCDVSDITFDEVARRALNLEMVRIVFEDDHCDGILAVSSELSDATLLAFADEETGRKGLTTLALTRCPKMSAAALSRVLEKNPITTLDLHKDPECSLGGLTDEFVLELADHLGGVRVLHLYGQSTLTDDTLNTLFTNPATHTLESICLNFTNVTPRTLHTSSPTVATSELSVSLTALNSLPSIFGSSSTALVFAGARLNEVGGGVGGRGTMDGGFDEGIGGDVVMSPVGADGEVREERNGEDALMDAGEELKADLGESMKVDDAMEVAEPVTLPLDEVMVAPVSVGQIGLLLDEGYSGDVMEVAHTSSVEADAVNVTLEHQDVVADVMDEDAAPPLVIEDVTDQDALAANQPPAAPVGPAIYKVPSFVKDEDRWFVDEGLDILSLWEGAVKRCMGSGKHWI
ncbi:hypothetical protein BC829DRAFT_494334 [Chytridium lagenaria]|nr:hypothetical protein BC829DRAFT_494334 [Chytridium lagenaria]